MRNNKNGFTLVELLAVIVILAIILVIAVPQIISTIEESRKGAFVSSAKLMASSAETLKLTNETLGITDDIECKDVSEYNDDDYQSCIIEFDDKGNAQVTLVGKGKFEGKYVWNGTKKNAEVTTESCTLVALTVELDGGVDTVDYEAKYEPGSKVTLTVPTKEGYRFIGWEVTGEGASVTDNELTIGSNATTIKAKWVELEAPSLTIEQELGESSDSPLVIGSSSYTLSGTLSAEGGIKLLTVNGNEVTVNEDGTWSYVLTLTQDVVTEISIVATDNYDVTTVNISYIKFEALVSFSYNGTILPGLPEWNKELYPYAFIDYVHSTESYVLHLSSDPITYSKTTTPIVGGEILAVSVAPKYVNEDGQWLHLSDGNSNGIKLVDNLGNLYRTVIWCNSDILNSDGNIYFASSEPVLAS